MKTTSNLPEQDTLRLHKIREGAFTLEDYSMSDLAAQIWIEEIEVMEDINLSPADILDCAKNHILAIEDFNEPVGDSDYLVEYEPEHFMTFNRWWDGLDPQDVESLLKASISTKVDLDLKRIYRELRGNYAQKTIAA